MKSEIRRFFYGIIRKGWAYIWHVEHLGIFFVVVFVKNAFDMEHWIIGALWEMEVSRLMAAIVYLLPQLPTNYHYSMLMHEIKLYYQSTLAACLGAHKGQREVLSSQIYMY